MATLVFPRSDQLKCPEALCLFSSRNHCRQENPQENPTDLDQRPPLGFIKAQVSVQNGEIGAIRGAKNTIFFLRGTR